MQNILRKKTFNFLCKELHIFNHYLYYPHLLNCITGILFSKEVVNCISRVALNSDFDSATIYIYIVFNYRSEGDILDIYYLTITFHKKKKDGPISRIKSKIKNEKKK